MTMTVIASPQSRTPQRTSRWATLCASLAGAIVLTACASMGTAPQDQVKQRATERWQALVAGEFDKAYSYNTPGFRALVTPAAYRGRTGSAVKWVGAEVTQVNCTEPAKCNVQIKLDYQPVLGGKIAGSYSTYLDESWLQEDSQWWIFQPISN